jgi:hypothetical protein
MSWNDPGPQRPSFDLDDAGTASGSTDTGWPSEDAAKPPPPRAESATSDAGDGPPVPQNHDGTAIEAGAVFFGDPGGTIGTIVSGTTNVNRHYRGGTKSSWTAGRVFLGLLGAGVGFGVAVAAASSVRADAAVLAMTTGGTGLGFFGFSRLIAIKHTATLVGTEGIAVYTRKRGRVRSEVFRFEQASEMRTASTRHYTNGVYTGTNFTNTWHRDGKVVHRIAGHYYEHKKRPIPKENPIHMAWAAERQWAMYQLPRLLHRVNAGEVVHFAVGNRGDYVGVGNDFIELRFKNETTRVERAELKGVGIHQGWVTIELVGSRRKLFGSEGIFRFAVATVSDFKLMLLLIEQALQIRIF